MHRRRAYTSHANSPGMPHLFKRDQEPEASASSLCGQVVCLPESEVQKLFVTDVKKVTCYRCLSLMALAVETVLGK